MELRFIEIDTNPNKPKATIHISGKLGFNAEAIKFMDLANRKYFKVALDEGEMVSKLYLVDSDDYNNSAKVAKAGQYYYLNMGDTFDKLKLDYKQYTIMFNIEKSEYMGKDMFVLTKRKPIKRKENDSQQNLNE